MPRNISFMKTKQQVYDREKDVTRRLGWKFVKSGDILNACEKCHGLGKGGKIVKICQIEVVSVTFEPLKAIRDYPNDCEREGFPERTPEQFIEFFIKGVGGGKITEDTEVTRIEFRYLK